MQTAKLFKNGQSQAVRLPKQFRFLHGNEVYIKRQGSSVVLTPKEESKKAMWDRMFAAIDKIGGEFPAREPQPSMQEREFNFD